MRDRQVSTNGLDFSAASPITPGVAQSLGSGITLVFDNGVGHTTGALWVIKTFGAEVVLASSPTVREHQMCSAWGNCAATNGSCTCMGTTIGDACQYLGNTVSTTQNGPVWTVMDWTVRACERNQLPLC
jgi:hypothetical protein